jgi:hypothetical protein
MTKEKTKYMPVFQLGDKVIWGNVSVANRAYRFQLCDVSMAEYFGSSIVFPEHNFYIRRDQGKICVKEGTIGTHADYDLMDSNPNTHVIDGSLHISKINEDTAKRLIEFVKTRKSNEAVEKDLESLLKP